MSEANLNNDVEDYECKVDGYNMIRSGGHHSRMISYVRNNLNYNMMEDLNTDVEVWLSIKIGKGKSVWKEGNFYREYRKIGQPGSEIETG